MSKKSDLVSVLIPCYNAEDWITECVESAFAQTYVPTEVIVVDDGSKDSSWERLQAFGDRIRAVRQENAGGNVARNHLLRLAKGTWLQYLDADDFLGPTKIAEQMNWLGTTQEPVDFIYGEEVNARMQPDGSIIQESRARTRTDPWEELFTWDLPQTGAPLWRKTAVEAVGGWKEDQPCCQEHELYARLLKAGKQFAYAGPSQAFYRHWSDETVCKKDVSLVHEKRMEIVREAYTFLKEKGMLTEGRRSAACQAAFETARSAWQYSPGTAIELRKWARKIDAGFRPTGPSAPSRFLWMERLFGYANAERLAARLRG